MDLPKLTVNIDHIATLREARKENFPDPVHAAVEAELAGCDGITVHLRTDLRHIKERDVKILKETVKTELNVEMAATAEMARIMHEVKPQRVTLVPESAGEITTQGGLNLLKVGDDLKSYVAQLRNRGIKTGIFIDPDFEQIKEAVRIGAQYVEINTNEYSKLKETRNEVIKIARVAKAARRENLAVHAGHGIDYHNIDPLLKIMEISSYSIGFSIVSRAVFVGLRSATEEMVRIIKGAR
jgi:pyridoxine 5-phosphate synthase